MDRFTTLAIDQTDAAISALSEHDRISGYPQFLHWPVDKAEGGASAVLWEATPGKRRFDNSLWEYCRTVTGVSIVTEDGGAAHTVRTADCFVLRVGLSGIWEVIETTRKDQVVRS